MQKNYKEQFNLSGFLHQQNTPAQVTKLRIELKTMGILSWCLDTTWEDLIWITKGQRIHFLIALVIFPTDIWETGENSFNVLMFLWANWPCKVRWPCDSVLN